MRRLPAGAEVMAATHASIVRRVLRDLEALPDAAPKRDVDEATAPLRDLFASFEGLPARARRRAIRDITGTFAYRQLSRRHARLTNQVESGL